MLAVTIRGLTKRFGDFLALDRIDLRIEPGELFFLLGPSGCGKTTLLRHIAGFLFPDAGQVLFGEQDVTRLPPHRRDTGMMFQSYALWPHLTVAQNVAFGLEERRRPKAEIQQRVAEALANVRMEKYGDRKINQLSGGQQQRVALARALVIRPRCLLLDEPLSNLDAKLRLEMRQEIRRVCKEFGLTAIYVTHDQKEALSIADRLAVLDTGRLAQIGTPREVYRRPRTRYVADFIGEANFLAGEILAPGDGENVPVRTALGDFAGAKTELGWSPAAGEKATLCIRPESWKLRETAPAGDAAAPENVIRGTIGRSLYLGEIAEYDFEPRAAAGAASPKPLKIFELNPRFLQAAADATEITAWVAPEDVVVLRN
ncbi:MAG: ABC transporter ATP-binding protein [Verrucomicrobia bacterium]|nr:ABC transporter ATP-binding protein [Verrucomicrobiota bacterium]